MANDAKKKQPIKFLFDQCLHNYQRGEVDKDCTQFAVLIQCHDSTGCDEMGDYFAIDADTMIDIVRLT